MFDTFSEIFGDSSVLMITSQWLNSVKLSAGSWYQSVSCDFCYYTSLALITNLDLSHVESYSSLGLFLHDIFSPVVTLGALLFQGMRGLASMLRSMPQCRCVCVCVYFYYVTVMMWHWQAGVRGPQSNPPHPC